MIRVHQASHIHNAVPVGIRVVPEGQIKPVLNVQQIGHGSRTRAIHPNFAIVVRRHECKLRVLLPVNHLQVQPVSLCYGIPHRQCRAPHGVNTQFKATRGNRGHIHHLRQAIHVVRHIVPRLGRNNRHPARRGFHPYQTGLQQGIRPVFNPSSCIRARRPAVWAVVFNTAIFRRIVGGRNNQAIRQLVGTGAVMGQNGMRHQRRWRIATGSIHTRDHSVAGQYLKHRVHSHIRQSVGIFAHIKGAANALPGAPFHHRLSDGEYVVAVKAAG